ncbi:hypothetical protein FQA47_004496 [Oryzias melastigma]|uniref:Uncharacterized protein n=1 Tax=Oryzias melastigma TaxID=30732 RepID=A0A834C883_ORYME|nr:hypothetical protein FQA47_004496 [Oryzias melastigma]
MTHRSKGLLPEKLLATHKSPLSPVSPQRPGFVYLNMGPELSEQKALAIITALADWDNPILIHHCYHLHVCAGRSFELSPPHLSVSVSLQLLGGVCSLSMLSCEWRTRMQSDGGTSLPASSYFHVTVLVRTITCSCMQLEQRGQGSPSWKKSRHVGKLRVH